MKRCTGQRLELHVLLLRMLTGLLPRARIELSSLQQLITK
jgi:hypothetical protein